jgi:putative PIG3 family NAD(P)H quinone oxidoreductase
MRDPLPAVMSVVEVLQPGGPEVLRAGTRSTPLPGIGEVLIEVAAAGVNRPDVLQRLGKYPPPPGVTDIPGLEVAGHIAVVGEGVTGWQLGDEVCALVSGGGYSQFCVAPAGQCLPVPRGWSLTEAAALAEATFTVWTNVFERGRLRAGESFLVHGGSSGIGVTAIQLGRAFGARVFATAGTDEKCAACERLGALRAINYRREDFVPIVRDATGGSGVDLILDMVGGDYVPRNLEALALEGRLVQIAFLRSPRVEVDLSTVMRRRLTITGSTLRPRTLQEKAAIAEEVRRQVWPLLDDMRVKPVIHASFPMAEAGDAHRLMESSAHIGKIVLTR